MQNSTILTLILICLVGYLIHIQPPLNTAQATTSSFAPNPTFIVSATGTLTMPQPATPIQQQQYVRTPNGQLIPVNQSEDAQAFQKEDAKNDPLAAPKGSNRHSEDELINSINNKPL